MLMCPQPQHRSCICAGAQQSLRIAEVGTEEDKLSPVVDSNAGSPCRIKFSNVRSETQPYVFILCSPATHDSILLRVKEVTHVSSSSCTQDIMANTDGGPESKPL